MKFIVKVCPALLLGLLIAGSGCTAGESKPFGAAQEKRGDTVLFTLKNLEDQDVSLGALLSQNKAVLINFWATWCPPCREEIPDLIKFQEKYGTSGFTVLGVDVGESKTKVSTFAKKFGMNYPIVLDSQMAVAERYKIVGIPTSILVNSEGKILGQYHAFTKKLVADVEKALQ